jgi:hypothetical protein
MLLDASGTGLGEPGGELIVRSSGAASRKARATLRAGDASMRMNRVSRIRRASTRCRPAGGGGA